MNPNIAIAIDPHKNTDSLTWDQVILVDRHDNPVGTEEKLKAHVDGKLHRAFSVFLFNPKGELLLQRRAAHKYHSPNLWTNTCCSHPQPNRNLETDAHARLIDEMGIDCKLKEVFEFIYRAEFKNGLTEYEYDHVFFGDFDGDPIPNPKEVSEWRWASLDTIAEEIRTTPEIFTVWFRECFAKVVSHR